MNAPELLAHVQARGASVRVEQGEGGAAVLVVAPRSRCVDLLPDLARFKPALVELLAPSQPIAPRSGPRPLERDGVDVARARLSLLESKLGTTGACRAVARATRRLQRDQAKFIARMNAQELHDLSVCVALLNASVALDDDLGATP